MAGDNNISITFVEDEDDSSQDEEENYDEKYDGKYDGKYDEKYDDDKYDDGKYGNEEYSYNDVDREDWRGIYNKYRSETQNHAKRIKDLIVLAQESRIRIDALLGKRTRARSDLDDVYTSSSIKRGSAGYDNSDEWNTRRESYDSTSSDRRTSRDIDRVSGRESRDSDYGLSSDRDRRQRRDYDRKDSRDSYESDNYKTDQVINLNSGGMVEVGGVSLSNKEIQMNQPDLKQKTIVVGASTTQGTGNIRASVNPSANPATKEPTASKPPPASKAPLKKPALKPSLAKSPFKFGTVSIQVKLDD